MRVVLVIDHHVEQQSVLLQRRRHARQKPAGQRIGIHRHAQALHARRRARLGARQAGDQVGLHQTQLPDMPDQRLAGRRRPDLLAAHQQPLAERGFERLDAQRHRRQRQAQRLGGRAKTAAFNHGGEGFKLPGIEHFFALVFIEQS